MSDKKTWRDILDDFKDKARSEFEGERGEELKEKLRGVRDDIEKALEGEDAQRIKDRLAELGKQTEDAINRAVKSDAARDIIENLEEALEDLGEKIEDLAEPPPSPKKAPEEDTTG
ncbi:MAG: hypothetical protein QF719_07340 [Chloroflexota bacterium]|jgi:hypothetical protein|nr:hypothetical protein [Chloroflexota bacterium]MDP6758012.1 hypothetical protein [Chloroflexota bacterium]